jgi:hypothetical protein
MISQPWRRILLSLLTVLFLLPAVSQAAPSGHRSDAEGVHFSAPAQWFNHLWQAVTGFWVKATGAATGTAGTTSGQGGAGGAAGDCGMTIDPHGACNG